MLSLNLPAFNAKITEKDGKNFIFDILRHRYVALTPEEWVRQHFVHFLIDYKKYPSALMANEVQIRLLEAQQSVFHGHRSLFLVWCPRGCIIRRPRGRSLPYG